MTIKKIGQWVKRNFRIKISYHDSYMNEDMTPENIEKETLEILKQKNGNNKRKIK